MKTLLYILLTILICSCSSDKNGGTSEGGNGITDPEKPIDPGIYDIENLNSNPVVMEDQANEKTLIPMDLTKIETPIGNVPTVPLHTGMEFGVYLKKTEERSPELLGNISKTSFYLLSFIPVSKENRVILNLYSPISRQVTLNLMNSLGEKVKSFHETFELGNNELNLDFTGLMDGIYAIDFVGQSFRINIPLEGNKM